MTKMNKHIKKIMTGFVVLLIIASCLFFSICALILGNNIGSYRYRYEAYSTLTAKLIIYGDINSYKEMKAEYDTMAHPQEFLYYSIVMALEHDYAPAYYDAYHALTSIFTDNPTLGKIDDKTKEEAMYFLRLGAQKGDKRAQQELKRINNNSNAVE